MALPASLRVVESGARVYRRTWRGSVISTFLNPVLFLLAMGVGLGELVDAGEGSTFLGLPYLTFLAPGLLAATAMQAAAGDASYPVMAGIKWRKTYHAALATPIRVRDLVLGHLGWVGIRLVFVTGVYAMIMSLFGATSWVQGLLAVPPAVLTGVAFAAAVTAYTARLENEIGLSTLFRFGILPLFLFSGTFFPVSQLPDAIEWFAYLTPLWHGVALCRGLALDIGFRVHPLVSFAYLGLWIVLGTVAAVRLMRRRLVL
ncbi:MAG TPA: ABC transporter permease [Gemmatimonadales bacterium]|nr:ABC transporter permease [Gemmatimonadales bacterium]